MAGPTRQSTPTFIVPPGEAQVQYSASSLAFKVQNFEMTPERTLRSILGPTPYEPLRNRTEVLFPNNVGNTVNSLGESDTPHGIYFANMLAGQVGMLVVRVGSRLYRHAGWERGWEVIDTDLASDTRPLYPDQFTVMNDKIIWTNGVDQARIIDFTGQAALLGFTQLPSAPTGIGPKLVNNNQKGNESVFPNHYGYSWTGTIGTPGNVLDGENGAILAGTWYYYAQLEDSFGNRSGLSAPSNAVSIETIQAAPYDPSTSYDDDSGSGSWIASGATLDDLTRQFAVEVGGSAPDNCTAIVLFRSQDTKQGDPTPRFLVRLPNSRQALFPDNIPDTSLGDPVERTIATPIFKHVCTHQGRLVVANVLGDPGIVRRSEPGFPGTFPELEFVYPDSGGAEVTAVTSHGGILIAFTETSVYSLQNFAFPVPLAQGIGCVAPRSIQALSNGMLIWLGRDGFYGMVGTQIQLLSGPIDRTIRHYISRSWMRMATATIDAESGEYQCSVARAGTYKNNMILSFDGTFWRRQRIGIEIADWCQVDDWRQYILALGQELDSSDVTSGERAGSPRVEAFVMGHATESYEPPDRTIIYRSGWLRGDDVGLTPVNVRTMFIGLVDSWNGDFTIKFYRNGSWSEFVKMTDVRAIGVDDGSNVVTDIAGSAVLGTSKLHDPRLFWRQIPVGIENAGSWAFEIRASWPTRLHVASFAFDISVATSGSPRGRIPLRADV
jgi:hypothetical protein